jgi:SAM-dependent methyltransferase
MISSPTTDDYKDYFAQHYRSDFTTDDIEKYRKWFLAQWKKIESIHPLNDMDTVLEIGSGLGGFATFIKNDSRYTGLELDSRACEFSQSHFPSKKFLNLSLSEFEAPAKVDRIYSFEVLEHLPDVISSIQKIHGLLKPKGIFIGTTPYPFRKNIEADETHLFVLHPENWKRLFEKNGFKVRSQPMSFLPYLWRVQPSLNQIFPFYIPFKYFISTTLIIATKN